MVAELRLATAEQGAKTALDPAPCPAISEDTHRGTEVSRRSVVADARPTLLVEREERADQEIDALYALARTFWYERQHQRVSFWRRTGLLAQRSSQRGQGGVIAAVAK